MEKTLEEGSEIGNTNTKDIETQEKDFLDSTKQTSEEEMSIEKEPKMDIPEGMELPKGHGMHAGQDISACPFFNVSEKAKNRKKKEEQKEDNKPKREEEYYGGGGGCPFMMSGLNFPIF
ncbi:MAG: hypothetical protein QF858_02315 [Candidatus Pacebacteria bacterium]|jgi:hypothetical protein|nr:hypothetical protein [Candidatus Paceibacterota bacterium]